MNQKHHITISRPHFEIELRGICFVLVVNGGSDDLSFDGSDTHAEE